MDQKIYAVGIDLPGDDFEFVPLTATTSLADADIAFFAPGFDASVVGAGSEARSRVPAAVVAEQREILGHWRRELAGLLAQGKTVIVLVAAPAELVAEGGAGSAASFAALPVEFAQLRTDAGRKMVPVAGAPDILGSYWQEFAGLSRYEASFDIPGAEALLATPAGRPVGALLRRGGGLVLLPPLEFDGERYTVYDTAHGAYFWTDAALELGARLKRAILDVAAKARALPPATPTEAATVADDAPPAWTLAPCYRLRAEAEALRRIDAARSEIAGLQARIALLEGEIVAGEARLPELRRYKALLCGSGEALAGTVREALSLLGAECDAAGGVRIGAERCLTLICSCPDGALDAERVLQLEAAIQADFAADGTAGFARGLLFVNPWSALEPPQRRDPFTPKALTAAQRFDFSLVQTVDLFRVVQYLEGKQDDTFVAAVRGALLRGGGAVVEFPPIPGE